MVTSQQLIDLIKPLLAKARELDRIDIPHRSDLHREAAIALGYSEGITNFLVLALHWENDIEAWIRHVEDGLIEP
jgi:hypothetical protein